MVLFAYYTCFIEVLIDYFDSAIETMRAYESQNKAICEV